MANATISVYQRSATITRICCYQRIEYPTDPISISDDDTERLPSYDIDTMLKILTDAEEMTQQAFKEQTVLPVNEIQKPTVNATQQRNHTNISTIQINPLSPESGYSTSSAPGSPKSISSRPSFSEEDQTPIATRYGRKIRYY